MAHGFNRKLSPTAPARITNFESCITGSSLSKRPPERAKACTSTVISKQVVPFLPLSRSRSDRLKGCDGDRLYYDGCQSIIVNGELIAQGSQFSLKDLEVTTATVDLDEVRSARFAPSMRMQVSRAQAYHRVYLPARLSRDAMDPRAKKSDIREIRFHCPEEEIALSPACW